MTDVPKDGESQVTVYVRVRLSDADRSVSWRAVKADSLTAGVKVAEQMDDVEVCLEASFIAGGAVT